MVEVQKATTGNFLSKKTLQEKGVKKIKILTEAKPVDTEYQGRKQTKLECQVQTDVLDPKECTWQMNPTTQNYFIDKFGSNTTSWIGKEIELAVKQAGSASAGVYPKDCSLEKVIT